MEYDEEYYLARVGSGARYQEDIPPQRFPSKGRGRPRMPREDIQEEEAIRRFAEIQIARDMESHANRQDITYSGQQPSRAGRHEGAEPDQEYERQQPSQAGRHEGAEQYQDPREDQFLKPINIMTRAQRQKIQSQQQPSRGAGLHDVPAQFYQEEGPEYGPATHSVPRGQLQEQTRQPPSRGAGQRMVAEPYQEYERQHPSQAGRHEGAEQYQDPREDQFLKPINIMTRAQRQKIQSQQQPSRGAGLHDVPAQFYQEEVPEYGPATLSVPRGQLQEQTRQSPSHGAGQRMVAEPYQEYERQQPSQAGRHEGAEPYQEYERQQPSQAGRHEGAEQYQDPREHQFLKPINIMTRAQRQKIQSQQQPSRGAGLHDVPAQFYQEEVPEYGPATLSVPRGQLQEQTRQPPFRGAGQRMVAEPYQEYERQQPSQAGRHEGAEQYQDPREDQFLKPINIMTRAQRQKIQSQQQPSRGAGLHDVPAQFYQEEVPEYGPATLSVPRGQLQEQTRQPPSRGAGQCMVAEPYQEYERQQPSQAGRHERAEQYQDPREDQFLKPINIMTRAQRQKIQSQQQPSRGAGLHDVPAQFYQEEVPEYGPATLSVPRGQLQEQTRQRDQRQQEGPRMPPPTESHGDAATPREPTNVELLSHAMQQLDMKNKNRSVVEKKGETGTQIKLTANYIPMHVTPGSGIFEYEVTFDPHVDHLACRFTLLKEMEEIIGSTRTFDGAMLYLPRKLESEIYRWCTTHPLNTTDVDVYVRYRRQRHMGECTQFYNVLLFRIMNELKLVRLGRQHYDPFAAKVLPQQKLEVWPGYVTSVEDYEGGLMLVCDASHRVLRQQTALDVIADITRTQFTECELEVKHLLVGASVLTRYNNKLYRIDDVCFSMSPRDTFVKNGREITFVDYYKQQYGLDILVMDQPVILTRQTFRSRNLAPGEREPTQFLVLIPELCYMTGLTDNMRNDHKGMKEIATVTLLNPNQRHYSIKQFLNGIEKCPRAQEILSAWGLSIARETVKLHGRILTGEELHFGNGAKIKVSNEGEWKNAVQRLNMLQVVDLLDWGLIYCQRDHSSTDNFVSTLLRVGPALGMVVREPTHVLKLDNDRLNTYMKALQCLVERKMQLVVLIFPTLRNDRYSAVKYFCNVQAGLLSQVIQAHTLNRCTGFSSIVQSIALQMNCKLGGALWTTPNPFKSVMVVGIDVYHDMKNKSRSVVGVVSSLNQNLTHYYSQVIYQDPKQELIDSLRYSFISSIEHYYNVNHCFPARIFIYRDGVGDGQLQTLVGHEVEQLINCFPDLTLDDEPYDPKFTVVVVQKRINTKLLAEKPQHQWENPPPGTVVDHTITKKFLYDFFLVAQSVRQGTVHPTHYIVAYDNSQLKPDYLQRFTYKLCHMYYNWMGIVRVPAPCQYAHRLAAHAGQHLKTAFHPALAEHLFYL